MRLFISADIEGVAGVADTCQTTPGAHGYDRAAAWMTGEVRAACEGAFRGGASHILVADSHGSAVNIDPDGLPDGVELISSWPRPLSMMQGVETGFDAVFLLGYHAGAHLKDGVLAHTFRGMQISQVRLNGEPADEMRVNAAAAGAYGAPVLLVTGDDVICAEARRLLGEDVSTVAVKTALGRLSARSLSPAKARAAISEAAEAAMSRTRTPYRIEGPIEVEIDFKHHWTAELLSYLPMFERLSAYTVRFTAADAPAAIAVFKFITTYRPLP
ncbi:MAG: M55 family metallopeptidase [Oceanicaulis sp.]